MCVCDVALKPKLFLVRVFFLWALTSDVFDMYWILLEEGAF